MLAQLVALVVPPCCAACRAPGLRACDALCPPCRRALPWLPAATCERCALPRPCRRCPAADAAFERAWAQVAYEGVARDAVRALKFARARLLADVMAAQIAACAPPALLCGGTLVAVPAHPRRRRSRGFDPAELLAASLARRTGLPLERALRRDASAARQLGATRSQRRDVDRLGFAAWGPSPQRAVLIDDVHTTGATLDACAAALRAAGARRIVAVTWARTLDKGPH
ncbi:MAG: ComF family protein [Actinomycetota bacterium]|nr:ComF family protein [Actinomycetota bacterium]